MTPQLTPVERELDALTEMGADRVLEAFLEQFGVPIDLHRFARAVLVTGFDMGMALGVHYPEEARIVMGQVERGAALTEADIAQRQLTFEGLVRAAREPGR